jgi:hypothetical protein
MVRCTVKVNRLFGGQNILKLLRRLQLASQQCRDSTMAKLWFAHACLRSCGEELAPVASSSCQ